MLTLPEHFSELLSAIEPTSDRLALAQDIPTKVRDFLKETEKVNTLYPHTRLVGSYARSTAINNIKDVDLLLFVDTSYHEEVAEVALNAVFSSLYKLARSLGDEEEPPVRRRQRRSINVVFKKANFSLDVVPVIALKGTDQPLVVPDREWNKWVPTHPLGYQQELSRINAEHKYKVVPLVKMLKYWRDVHMTVRRPKSYWLEALVYQHVASQSLLLDGNSYAEIFHKLLAAIYDHFCPYLEEQDVPAITDPMLGHNVAHNWERAAFKAFMDRVEESRNWSYRALNADSEQDAVALWLKVFNPEKFPPSEAHIKGRNLLRAQHQKSISIASSSHHLVLQRPSESSIDIPSQKFFGGN